MTVDQMPNLPPSQAEARQLLIDLLREAAQLEQCLLNAYLFAACSLKSTAAEFEKLDEKTNLRRGIQFELVRNWKVYTLNVAHEEMMHLHYVQCLLRALGERPCFDLPDRDTNGNWVFTNWNAHIATGAGKVPVAPGTAETFHRFFLYESSDAVQDLKPFENKELLKLLDDLLSYELDLYFEGLLYHLEDEAQRRELKGQLRELYEHLAPAEVWRSMVGKSSPSSDAKSPSVEEMPFQSISDFYEKAVLPLYQQAFDFKWVKNTNRDLNNELQDPKYAAEGFLPIGPVNRTQNFTDMSKRNSKDPLRSYKKVKDIVDEIVVEGEGNKNFLQSARKLLDTFEAPGGTRKYVEAIKTGGSNPPGLVQGGRTRTQVAPLSVRDDRGGHCP
jgi:hypothetical protein